MAGGLGVCTWYMLQRVVEPEKICDQSFLAISFLAMDISKLILQIDLPDHPFFVLPSTNSVHFLLPLPKESCKLQSKQAVNLKLPGKEIAICSNPKHHERLYE